MNKDEELWLDVFSKTTDQFQKYLDLLFKSMAIYLAVSAALFKFALDSQSTEILRYTMIYIGVSFSIIYGICIKLASKVFAIIRERRNESVKILKLKTKDEFISAKWASSVFYLVVIVILIGWTILLVLKFTGYFNAVTS